jgi:hypothetical protein
VQGKNLSERAQETAQATKEGLQQTGEKAKVCVSQVHTKVLSTSPT